MHLSLFAWLGSEGVPVVKMKRKGWKPFFFWGGGGGVVVLVATHLALAHRGTDSLGA